MAVKKVFVLAGEASGDVLGAEFLSALRAADPSVSIAYTGGPAMRAVLQGQVPSVPMEQMAFMGFAEVLRHLPQIWSNDQTIKRTLLHDHPDLVVLIDYPGYGLRLAKWLNARGFRRRGGRVVQLVSPQFWAWKPGRLATLKSCFDAVYPLLPFESPLLTKAGVVAPYFGHPAAFRVPSGGWDPEGPIALLPGSRTQEWAHHVPIFSDTAQALGREVRWYRPAHIQSGDYQRMLARLGVTASLEAIHCGVPSMQGISGALVASGTATLEVALRGIPLVVAYKTSRVSYEIGKRVIRVPYISLVNLILDRPAVAECVQDRCAPDILTQAMAQALTQPDWDQTVAELRQAVDLGDAMSKIVEHARTV